MAIVKMNKISIIGLEKNKNSIMEILMKMGVVEISNLDAKISQEEWAALISRDGDDSEITRLDTEIERVKSAIAYLAKFDTGKKGLFSSKRTMTYDQYHDLVGKSEEIWQVEDKISHYDTQLAALRSEENKNANLAGTLAPWITLDIPLEISATNRTMIYLGVIPAIVDTEKLQNELAQEVQESYLEVINADKDQSYLLVMCHASCEENALKLLKRHGFSRVTFKEITGTISESINKLQRRAAEIMQQRVEIEKNIAALAGEKQRMEVLYDHLTVQRDTKKAMRNMARTEKTFMLEGWLPAKVSDQVEKEIAAKWDCIVDVAPPQKDEEHPVLLENHSMVQPFELITELYGVPKSKTFDANIVMAPFYFAFFGLMVSDAGYGLVMALITGILLARVKLQGLVYKLVKLLFFGGISTFLWGVLFGGWFGNVTEAVTAGRIVIQPLWFNPLDDPMRLLIWAFVFGGIHLYAGMALQAYKLIRDGHLWDAILDVGLWYVFLTGLVFLGIGGNFGIIGTYMSIIGVISLVLTQGRREKGILKKLLMGILSLYSVTGFMSDVLSYSRLLALGLATGVIATVVNTMGVLFGFSSGGILIFTIVFIGGHTFNILINTLGAYVHASRLQYVEFFGKFFEGGGKAFRPFKINTKYIYLDDKEAV